MQIIDQPQIAIRSLQHYLYCSHRWGLIEIGRVWAENYFVTKSNLLHERVHEMQKYHLPGKKVFTSVPVYHDGYGIYGVVDCIEAPENTEDILLRHNSPGYRLGIVEYKPTMPKTKECSKDDCMQIYAQKICVENISGCQCQTAIYYADTRQRISVSFEGREKEYNDMLKEILAKMRENIKEGRIPPIEKGQKCSGCSLKDLCMPSARKMGGVRGIIAELTEGLG